MAERQSWIPLRGGLDYRGSRDWMIKLGVNADQFESVQQRCIDFLHEVPRPFESSIDKIEYVGIVGPRGEAYQLNETITPETAEEYH